MVIRDFIYIAILSVRDILHEKLLSFCMVLSLGAIFAPLIILLGLQKGIIGNMYDKLKSDPESRLVRPKFISQSPLPQKVLKNIEDTSGVFIPSAHSHLLLDIDGLLDSKGRPKPVNAVPAIKADPFIAASAPDFAEHKKWVVISEPLRKKMNLKKGQFLTILLRRTVTTGWPEEIKFNCLIAGVVPEILMIEKKIFLPLNVFNDIYRWRKGYAAPKLGLPGTQHQMVTPEYDGALTSFDSTPPDDEVYNRMLAGRLPFSSAPHVWEKDGWRHQEKEQFLWQTINSTIFKKDIQVFVNRHLDLGFSPQVTPYIRDLYLKHDANGSAKRWKLTTLPEAFSPPWQPDEMPVLFISMEDKDIGGVSRVTLTTGLEDNKASIPVVLRSSTYVQPGYIAASHHLAGLFRSAKRQGAIYDSSKKRFFLKFEHQIRYFRAYADSIDTLESLVELVIEKGKKMGVRAMEEPVSRLGEVQRIRTISAHMEKVYILLAAISAVATIFVIAASVFATVHRKRSDLAYLNMLGVAKKMIVFFPFVKSMLLISGGVTLAFSAYLIFGYVSSPWFVELLGPTASLTRLGHEYVGIIISAIGLLGSVTSLLAAASVGRIKSERYVHE